MTHITLDSAAWYRALTLEERLPAGRGSAAAAAGRRQRAQLAEDATPRRPSGDCNAGAACRRSRATISGRSGWRRPD